MIRQQWFFSTANDRQSAIRCFLGIALIAVLSACAGPRQWDTTPPTPPSPPATTVPTATPAVDFALREFSPRSVSVATDAEPLLLTRADCVARALRANRGFRITHLAMTQAQAQQRLARAQVYAPKLTVGYTLSNGPDTGAARADVAVPVWGFDIQPYVTGGWNQYAPASASGGAGSHTTAYGITVSRLLFNVNEQLRQHLPIEAADQAFYVAANRVILDGKDLDLRATRAFFAVQGASARLNVRSRRVVDAETFLQAVKKNVQLGFKAPVEAVNATIDLNQARADALGDRTALRNAEEALLNLLAEPLTRRMTLDLQDAGFDGVTVPTLDDDLARVRTHHEDLGSRLAEIDLNIDQLRIATDQLAPQVKAAFNAERRHVGDAFVAPGAIDDTAVSLSLTYSTPLDGWAQERARVSQLRDQIETATLRLRDTEADLEQRLRSAHRRMVQLLSTVDLSVQRLAAERAKLEATLVSYQAGTIDNLEVTRAKQALDNAEIGLLDARISLVLAAAEYRAILPIASAPPLALSAGGP